MNRKSEQREGRSMSGQRAEGTERKDTGSSEARWGAAVRDAGCVRIFRLGVANFSCLRTGALVAGVAWALSGRSGSVSGEATRRGLGC